MLSIRAVTSQTPIAFKALASQGIVSVQQIASHASCRCHACTKNNSRRAFSSSTVASTAATVDSIHKSFRGSVPNSELISTIIHPKLSRYGYDSTNTLVATSLCADEVNRTLEQSLSKTYDMPNFSMGGLAGFPFGGITAFGAMASHIPDGGHCLVVYGPHVGVDSKGAVGTVERVKRANGGACCGSAVAASGYVQSVYKGTDAKYGASLDQIEESVYKKLFEHVDANQDGLLDKSELMTVFSKLDVNLSLKEFDTIFAELDTSGDGTVSEQEFGTWVRQKRSAKTDSQSAHESKLLVDPTDAQQQFVGNLLLPHAERLDKAGDNKMVELPYALFDAQKALMDEIVNTGKSNVAGKGHISVLGGIQINTPETMEDYFLPLSMEVYEDKTGNPPVKLL